MGNVLPTQRLTGGGISSGRSSLSISLSHSSSVSWMESARKSGSMFSSSPNISPFDASRGCAGSICVFWMVWFKSRRLSEICPSSGSRALLRSTEWLACLVTLVGWASYLFGRVLLLSCLSMLLDWAPRERIVDYSRFLVVTTQYVCCCLHRYTNATTNKLPNVLRRSFQHYIGLIAFRDTNLASKSDVKGSSLFTTKDIYFSTQVGSKFPVLSIISSYFYFLLLQIYSSSNFLLYNSNIYIVSVTIAMYTTFTTYDNCVRLVFGIICDMECIRR